MIVTKAMALLPLDLKSQRTVTCNLQADVDKISWLA